MPLRVVGIACSLRAASFNHALLHAAAELGTEHGLGVETHDIAAVPLFNQDDEQSPPAPVAALREHVVGADAVLFATPEYNHGLPGVAKNIVDWLSRPPGRELSGKPVASIGASTSVIGTARAQLQMRHTLSVLGAFPLGPPEVLVPTAAEKFEDGRLIDEQTRKFLDAFMKRFASHIRKVEAFKATE